jgi:hypothetical protein
MKFTYGFTVKTIRGKEYVYFWKYVGTGRKTEQYIGRVGKPQTRKRALQVKLAYLIGLQEEITCTIKQAEQELAEL